MVYSFFMEPVKQVIRNSVDLLVPSNSFNAMATAAAGYYGYLHGATWSQGEINKIFRDHMNCTKAESESGADFVATELGKAFQNNILENVGIPFASLYDRFAGGDEMQTTLKGMVANNTANVDEAINCIKANTMSIALTPHLSQFLMNYYYPIKFMVITSVTLNIIALALFKTHSYLKRCCMASEQIELTIAVAPIKTIQDKPRTESKKAMVLSETTPGSMEEYLKKMEKDYTEKVRLMTQPLQFTLDAVTIQLERVTKTLVEISKKIEDPHSTLTVTTARKERKGT